MPTCRTTWVLRALAHTTASAGALLVYDSPYAWVDILIACLMYAYMVRYGTEAGLWSSRVHSSRHGRLVPMKPHMVSMTRASVLTCIFVTVVVPGCAGYLFRVTTHHGGFAYGVVKYGALPRLLVLYTERSAWVLVGTPAYTRARVRGRAANRLDPVAATCM